MTIDRSGRWWTGSEASDVEEYLTELTAGQEVAARFTQARCSACGSDVFGLRYDATEGWAQRRCAACRSTYDLLDSGDLGAHVRPTDARCPCGGRSFNLTAGFAPRGKDDVRWVYLGLRCTRDGVLACCADWGIDYSPSAALVEQV